MRTILLLSLFALSSCGPIAVKIVPDDSVTQASLREVREIVQNQGLVLEALRKELMKPESIKK